MPKTPNIRFRIDFAEHSNLGPGKIDLLEAIEEHGSVSTAARVLKLSYRRAWLLLDSLNRSFDKPVTVNSVGGTGGGGARVTEFGTLLIRRYRELEKEISTITRKCLQDILPRVSGGAPSIKSSLKRTSLTKGRARR